MSSPRPLTPFLSRVALAGLFGISTAASVAAVPQTIFFPQPSPTIALVSGGLAVSASSGLPVVLESLTPAVCSVSNTSGDWGSTAHIGGVCTVVARQPGNEIYEPAEDVTRSWQINRRAQTIVFLNPRFQFALQSFTVHPYASDGLRPVTLASETPTVCTVEGMVVTLAIGGICTLVASHAGDAVYLPAEDVRQSFEVGRLPQTITFTDPGPLTLSPTPVALRVRTSSGLPVTLTSSTSEVCDVTSTSVLLLKIGTCTIVARQGGDASYEAAPDVTLSFAIAAAVPGPPTDVTVSIDGAHVTLSWTPSASGSAADYFLVEIGDAPGRTTLLTWLTRDTFSIGALPSGDHFLRVRALNANGMSAPSADVWARVETEQSASSPPVGFTAQVSPDNMVSLSWQPGPTGAPPDDYLLEIGSERGSIDIGTIVLPDTTTSMNVPNVPPGVYVVRVRARNAVGYTPPAADILLRVGAPGECTAAPQSPVMLTPVVAGRTIAATWLESAGVSSSFVLEAGSAAGQRDLLVADVGAVTGIAATVSNGIYALRTIAQSACGAGPASIEQPITVGGLVPAAPTDLTAAPGSGGMTFTWTPPVAGASATHYLLEAGPSSGTTLLMVPVGATSTVTVPGIPSGVTFVARIRAVNASGAGAASTEIVVTVP